MKRSFFAVAAFSLLALSAHAQQASGNLMGNAQPGDTVEVTGNGTGWHREVAVQESGKWMIRQVPLGEYTVVVKHADGTAEKAKGAAVRAGSTARVK
ncbi:CcoS domain containing protein [Lysobacter dokdonensis DS-58]|uniref:CcoS domain containing protein n=1 Tax=Lysobacter dokdonensis DS-58 TaxID=1300345 RepID=A0A0A2WYS9_9GAMM|nr:carboxypeptidase-like regulatory domain-containing protein [Lysobacter dokdonensis]KGQ18129.1 CcoS domain containing protein [Lysobacter dokdonensis DS-58]